MVRCRRTLRKVLPPWSSRSSGVFSSLCGVPTHTLYILYVKTCIKKYRSFMAYNMFIPRTKDPLGLLFDFLKI